MPWRAPHNKKGPSGLGSKRAGEGKVVTPIIAAPRSTSSDNSATPAEKFVQLPKRLMRRSDLSPKAKLVYAVITDRIGVNGQAWPGYSRTAADTGLHLSSAKRAVAELITAGLLRKIERGPGLSNMYAIPDSAGGSRLHPVQGAPGADCDSHPVQAATQVVAGCDYRELTHELDPLNETRQRSKKKSPQFSKAECERIYQVYPRKVGKAAALKAIDTALRAISKRGMLGAAAWLLDRVEKYAASPSGRQGKFTPHPAKWFNQARYDDDENEWANTDGNARSQAASPARSRAEAGKYDDI